MAKWAKDKAPMKSWPHAMAFLQSQGFKVTRKPGDNLMFSVSPDPPGPVKITWYSVDQLVMAANAVLGRK